MEVVYFRVRAVVQDGDGRIIRVNMSACVKGRFLYQLGERYVSRHGVTATGGPTLFRRVISVSVVARVLGVAQRLAQYVIVQPRFFNQDERIVATVWIVRPNRYS